MNPRGHSYTPHGHTGLTPKEATVMADWDAGMTTQEISRRHDFDYEGVARIVSYYDGTAEYPRFKRATVAASNQLAAAIGRAFPERMTA